MRLKKLSSLVENRRDKINMKHNDKTVKKSSKVKSNEQCGGDLEYESLFDDARNMAFTLRKIDQELRIAAQCEGNHPGGISVKCIASSIMQDNVLKHWKL